jgi:hypothetical protein
LECKNPATIWASSISKQRFDLAKPAGKFKFSNFGIGNIFDCQAHYCARFAAKLVDNFRQPQTGYLSTINLDDAVADFQLDVFGRRFRLNRPRHVALPRFALQNDTNTDAADLLVDFISQRRGLNLGEELRMLIAVPLQFGNHAVHRAGKEIAARGGIKRVVLDGSQTVGQISAIGILRALHETNVRNNRNQKQQQKISSRHRRISERSEIVASRNNVCWLDSSGTTIVSHYIRASNATKGRWIRKNPPR